MNNYGLWLLRNCGEDIFNCVIPRMYVLNYWLKLAQKYQFSLKTNVKAVFSHNINHVIQHVFFFALTARKFKNKFGVNSSN